MGWVVIAILAVAVLAALWRVAKLPRSAMELVAAALLLGVAGYAWQGSPTLAGRPTPPREDAGPADVEKLPELKIANVGSSADVLAAADGLIERRMASYAVATIKAALARSPNNADLWVGLGNALVVHNEGQMSPAAQLAFDRAGQLVPDHPGPPFFMGLAYAQAGQLDRAEQVWRDLLDRSPAGAPWRGELEQRLASLDAVRAQQGGPTP
jgi:tetratricopeptide (TPR) repeat protein